MPRVITKAVFDHQLEAIGTKWERKLGERMYGPGADKAGIAEMNRELETFKESVTVVYPRLPAAMARTPAADQAKAAAQAITPMVTKALKIRKKRAKAMKRAKKSARVAAAAARRESAARVQLAETFSPPAVAGSLREGSRENLAEVAATALGSAGLSPFHRASPRGAITEQAAAAGRVLEAAADPPGLRKQLADGSNEDLREQLRGRLNVLSEASGFGSPLWTTGGRASA